MQPLYKIEKRLKTLDFLTDIVLVVSISGNKLDPVNYQRLLGLDDIGDTPNLPGLEKETPSYCDYAI